ncbi:hypothetical protein [Nostoc sp.]|uniref:hypothetical protein n=1 Tax=Nostoc sp. TaxID=1180 RepID=UPI002FF817BC
MTKPSSKHKKATFVSTSDSTPSDDLVQEENPASATITVTAVEVPELTEAEERDRLNLERKVERAFFEAGKALMELRDRRLYRSTHKTFEDYCRDRFGFSRRQPYHLMEAAVIFDNLVEKCERNVHIFPTNEWQVRPLTKLDPDNQPEAWQQALESANGKVPSHRIVKDVVQRIMERTQVPNTYQLGEVCQILVKDNPDWRGKGGCWGIVNQVGEFSCTVAMWDGEYTVRIDHLKPLNYLPAECKQMQLISDRITRVYSDSLEETVKSLLHSLGKLNRPYLTGVEEKLLNVLEIESRL